MLSDGSATRPETTYRCVLEDDEWIRNPGDNLHSRAGNEGDINDPDNPGYEENPNAQQVQVTGTLEYAGEFECVLEKELDEACYYASCGHYEEECETHIVGYETDYVYGGTRPISERTCIDVYIPPEDPPPTDPSQWTGCMEPCVHWSTFCDR